MATRDTFEKVKGLPFPLLTENKYLWNSPGDMLSFSTNINTDFESSWWPIDELYLKALQSKHSQSLQVYSLCFFTS